MRRAAFRSWTHLPTFRGSRTPLLTAGNSLRRLLALAAVSAVACVVTYILSVQTEAGQLLADLILFGRRAADLQAITSANQALGTISLASGIGGTAVLVLIALVSGRVRLAMAVAVAIGGANLTAQVLKRVLERPDLLAGAYAAGNSFPSGHVTVAAALAFGAVLVAPRRLRTLVAALGAGYVGLIALSTIVTGWHRLADVVGAVSLTLAWAALCAAVVVRRRGFMPRRTWTRASGGTLIVAFGLAGLIAAVVGGVALLGAFLNAEPGSLLTAQPGSGRAFLGGLSIAVASVFVAMAAFVWAMAGISFGSGGGGEPTT